ncbi:hypothetical protein Q5692_19825 [Microcoleus sp. C2C3]|uniref:hypothetical protein n=1 Tax=unclassified Microcoleus TaxID=2642155 RepID=UPI002FD62FA0
MKIRLLSSKRKQPASLKNLVALPKADTNSNGQLTAKLKVPVWRLVENFNILCSRPALCYPAGRLGFWVFLENQKPGDHIMSQEFVPDDNFSARPNDASAVSEQEVVRITVVGSRAAVLETIHTLYRLGFAQVGDWSPPQRGAKPGQVISVLIRRSRKA